MGILLQILSILIALVAITVSWQIVRNTHRIAFHGESAWRKALTVNQPGARHYLRQSTIRAGRQLTWKKSATV